jgi:Uncharacterized protein conserved in bacteria
MIDEKGRIPSLEDIPTHDLPLGALAPRGWYKDILRLQADNFTGLLDEHWDSVGSYSAWLGGTGENWERGPYYVDGLVPLAYLLGDEKLIAKAKAWIEWSLGSQTEEGDFGPRTNADWWPRMVMLKVLMQYEEATGDGRVIPFMLRYASFLEKNLEARPLSSWGKSRGGELILWLFWLYGRVETSLRDELLDLASRVYSQTLDWDSFCHDLPFVRPAEFYLDWRAAAAHYSVAEIIDMPQFLFTHVVNVAMGLKTPTLFSRLTRDPRQREALKEGAARLASRHGVVTRMFNGDEHLAGNSPSRGTELCAVVEYMFSLESVLDLYSDTWAADTLELLAFNALPATISGDFRGHQYLQQANQVLVSKAARDWFNNNDESNLFGLEPNFGCCTANLHQGWPKLAKALWRASSDGGFAAFVYAPSLLEVRLPSGSRLRIETVTDYPFGELLRFRIGLDRPERFPLKFRIPAWCRSPRLFIGQEGLGGESVAAAAGSWASINRLWRDGDEVELRLPMEIRASFWCNDSVGLEYGPLVLALGLGEEWKTIGGYSAFPDRAIESASPWNYALRLEEGGAVRVEGIERSALPASGFSFARDQAPLVVRVRGRRVPSWGMERNSAAVPPRSPLAEAALDPTEERLDLVPYAFARLRVSQFPWYRPSLGTE